ncbi:BPSL0067 family protein [Salmonella enterica]|uniref:BPSL0067 family protein n=1 Tax=Salmonella enterica TaxID=28901 RepID=UPI003D25D9EC
MQKLSGDGGSRSGTWKQGRKVFGDKSIPRGTAIATFVNGKYPSGSAAHKL